MNDPTHFDALSPWLCSLPDMGLLAIGGSDAAKFLQGQTTCDMLQLAPGRTSLGAICNPKGRVVALFRAFRQEGAFYLLLPTEIIEAVRKRLRMYVLRADVKIEDIGGAWTIFGVGAADLTSALEPFGIPVPANPDDIIFQADCRSIRIPSAEADRLLLLIRNEKAEALRTELEAGTRFTHTEPSRWRLTDIQAGIPWVGQAVSEEFIPQMLNLDLLGGISFSKGCYTGQEIVARTHYLGNLKRRMFRLQSAGGVEPKAGAAIHTAEPEAQSIGMVVIAAPAAEGSHQMLAVLNIAQARRGDLRLNESSDSRLSLLELPYQSTADHTSDGPKEKRSHDSEE